MKRQSKTFLRAGGLLLALTAATLAQADELPTHKAGLWEMKVSVQLHGVGELPPSTSRKCVDATSEKESKDTMRRMHEGDVTCAKDESKKTATGYVLDSVCTSKSADMTTTTHAEITGDFNSGYTMKTTTQVKGEQDPARMTVENKYLGACPAGWKPGDVEMNGHRFNPKEMIK